MFDLRFTFAPTYIGVIYFLFMEYLKLTKRDEFSKELTRRVEEFLKSNYIRKEGRWRTLTKVPVLLGIYFVPYILVLTGVFEGFWAVALSGVLMGLGMAFIGLAVMHDAVHGAFAKRNWVNKLMGYTMEMLGGSSLTWKIQHNVLHHSFTNVHGLDEDINPPPFLRFTPDAPLKKVHRFQAFFAWFFYGLMTFMWVTTKNFTELKRYKDMNLLQAQGTTYAREMTKLIIGKILYLFYLVAIPIMFTSVIWWHWIIAFTLLHFVCGLVLAFVFQCAHVVPEAEFVTHASHDETNPEQSWAVHQLATTANFENWNKVLTWFVGGLNHQIEHHLFPEISHVHYPKISKIVKQTAEEFGYAYNYHRTFVGAIVAHLRLLNRLGQPIKA